MVEMQPHERPVGDDDIEGSRPSPYHRSRWALDDGVAWLDVAQEDPPGPDGEVAVPGEDPESAGELGGVSLDGDVRVTAALPPKPDILISRSRSISAFSCSIRDVTSSRASR